MTSRKSISHILPFQAFLLILTLWVPSLSQAALNAYMTVDSATQGTIEGDVTLAGREGTIEVISFGYNVISPRDAASGLPTGRRQHRPIRILKNIDKSSPLLFSTLVNNDVLNNVTIRFYRPSRTGQEEQFYTVSLTNASIAGIMPIHSSATDSASTPMREMISLTFQTITVTYENGGISAEDDWESVPR